MASMAESSTLKFGLDVDRPYRTELVAENYTKLTALSAQSTDATSEKLTINKQKAITFEIDDIDKMQNMHDTVALYSADAAKTLAISQDAEFLYEALNANDTVDAGDLGGTAGTGITLTTANIDSAFSVANRKLDTQNADEENRVAAVSSQFFQVLWERLAGKESILGDKTAEFASQGTYAGFRLYKTNNLTASARWTPANNPSNNDTITINGITFTFVTTIGTAAGNVLVAGSTALTIDNLVALINAGGVGDGVNHVSLSLANKRTVQSWVAVDGTTYIDVRAKGASYMTVSGSEVADVWSLKKQHNLFGVKGCVDMVVQKEISADTDKLLSAGKFGVVVGLLTVFGIKSFNRGTKEMVDVEIDTSSF
jgi:hypothetical protein